MKRRVRVLLAWFERHDAVNALLGFRLPEPQEDVSALVERFEHTRAALLARPRFEGDAPPLEPLPPEIRARGEEQAEHLRGRLSEPGALRDLAAGTIDLTRIVSFQKAVALDQIEERVSTASQDDWIALADLCLPRPAAEAESPLQGTFDKDGKGVTITSFNPNLRVSPVQHLGGSNGDGQTVGFQVVFGTSHLHVIEYRGRCFLKDGYHRAFGLIARGITRVPVIYERAGSFADVHSGSSSFVTQELLLGDHPPRLTDFHDLTVSDTVEQQSYRKVIRIRAEEFVVQV